MRFGSRARAFPGMGAGIHDGAETRGGTSGREAPTKVHPQALTELKSGQQGGKATTGVMVLRMAMFGMRDRSGRVSRPVRRGLVPVEDRRDAIDIGARERGWPGRIVLE